MALQNRVTPWGEIIATSERGMFMGNRGCLHDDKKNLKKQWVRNPWITCLLQFQNRHRNAMSPGLYTELFFLDEATALAAGHRPCATCRRKDYDEFKAKWLAANSELAAITGTSMGKIDKALHSERVDENRRKRTWSIKLGELPDGAMFAHRGLRSPFLIRQNQIYSWTPGGYTEPKRSLPDLYVDVLTPRSVVNTLTMGYGLVMHRSAH